MAAQAERLTAQRFHGDLMMLRLPFIPLFPDIATTPAGHHQDSLFVRQVEELIGFNLAFQTQRIQVEMLDIVKFLPQTLRSLAKEHVLRPSAAENQQSLAVDLENTILLLVEF